ncbi:MAG: hypothetical protein Q8O74_01260 [bacterium]|nr:hypothetical protein [bacterium]
MKKTGMLFLTVLILTVAAWASPIQQSRIFGLGLIAGDPSGLSLKYWKGSANAIQGSLAWSFLENGYLRANADYLWHEYELIKVEKGTLPLYYGPGVTLWAGRIRDGRSGANIGVRGVCGLEYIFKGAPFDIFLELAPTLDLAPSTGLWIQGGLGARYYF